MFWKRNAKDDAPKIGLILSGGGARAAYQVGVLKAVAELVPKDAANPFPIICGTSAGAINAAALAIYSAQFREAVWRMVHVWGNFHVGQVFKSDFSGLSCSALRWMFSLLRGGSNKNTPVSLLNREPLTHLLNHYLPFNDIQKSIDDGYLHSLCITASNFVNGHSVAFYQGIESIEPWVRANRVGIPTQIGIDHLMASSAIPFLFAPQEIGGDYYGDGTMRQNAPTSPALHLGADKLFVIGVKHEDSDDFKKRKMTGYPSLGQIAGHVLDSIFLDNVSTDLERLEKINKTFRQIPDRHIPDDSATIRKVDILSIAPSKDLYTVAAKHYHYMPSSVRLFMRGLGTSNQNGSNLISYLLFEKAYCRELIALGYSDTLERREEIIPFLNIEEPNKK